MASDILVIGAGIAGVSAAALLADSAKVTVLEMEPQPGYHATGRSAAFFAPAYGNAVVRALTAAAEPFYLHPPSDFTDVELLRPRPCIYLARKDQLTHLSVLLQEIPALQPITALEICKAVPILNADYAHAGLFDSSGGDLDVDAILQGYIRLFRRRGGTIETTARVQRLCRKHAMWRVETADNRYDAPIVINAAGAWADEVAKLAGIEPLGLQPKRRTAILIDAPKHLNISNWPLIIDVEEEFYFKPDAGALLISPADETPSPPCDAQPEEMDIAIAVERFERATGIEVARINHRWAGLRTFAPDKTFVVGFDPRAAGFFWLAGQGGYGVQSAPGVANLAAALLQASRPASGFERVMDCAEHVSPERLLRS